MTTWLAVVFSGIAALGGLGGIAAWLLVRDQKHKIKAEAKKLNVDADAVMSDRALAMYDRVSKEAASANRRATNCERRMDALEDHVGELKQMLRANGITPPPFQFPLLNIADGGGDPL